MNGTSDLDTDVSDSNFAQQQKKREASFTETYDSLEMLLRSKLAKFDAMKSLVNAEAKLSLSAILLIAVSWAVLAGFILTLWLLLNVALGLGIYTIFGALWLSVVCLIIVNLVCSISIFKYIQHLTTLVGLPHTLASLKEE